MKKFIYQIYAEGMEYSEATVKQLLGPDGKFNPEIGEDYVVRQDVNDLFADAIAFCLHTKMEFLQKIKSKNYLEMKDEDKRYIDFIDAKISFYKRMKESLTPLKSEQM